MNKWISGLLTATLILCPVTGCTALGASEEAVNQNQQVKSAVNNKSTAQVPLTSRAGAAQNTADPLNFANENEGKEALEKGNQTFVRDLKLFCMPFMQDHQSLQSTGIKSKPDSTIFISNLNTLEVVYTNVFLDVYSI